ncbi:SDR family NAD(P)-dependent oxidoreductase [Kordiimonas aquimaris]|uniref:SDR family NAD(P)-dependent oxidoreductase n=1 Tax=Kordiimonas aquimaris TaxID=707591 RepID=UPI0021D05514|nr:SDR family NAD(P)-dependent oxidoreductase [Kordiimonas aquimaris]
MSKGFALTRRQLMAGTAAVAATASFSKAQAQASGLIGPDLTGKSVLITGSSSGFGRLGAEHYARLGAKVFATMRNLPRPEADELRELAERENLDIHVLEIDVLSDDLVERGVNEALVLADGKIDVLINNAGIGITGPIEAQDMIATKLAFDTNVFGAQRMVRAVLPSMRAAGSGQIFAISSQLGRLIVPSAGHYSATKFALEALTEQLAYELVPHNIDVTIIQPGGYPTKVWVNRNRYTRNLRERLTDELKAGYPQLVAAMGEEDGSSRRTDSMDIPRAIAEIMVMPAGKRPLRKAVHPTFRPQEAVNAACDKAQLAFLGNSGYGPWVKAAHNKI